MGGRRLHLLIMVLEIQMCTVKTAFIFLNKDISPLKNIGDIFSFIGILILILIAAYYVTKKIGKTSNPFNSQSSHIKLIDRLGIARDKSLMIVQVANKGYLIGVSGQSITTIAVLNEEEMAAFQKPQEDEPTMVGAFIDTLKSNIKWKFRSKKRRGEANSGGFDQLLKTASDKIEEHSAEPDKSDDESPGRKCTNAKS